MRLIVHFLREDKAKIAKVDVGIGSKNTIVDHYNFLREVCDVVQHHDFKKIGGKHDIVEVM
jgi:hypothetical protein